jgi:hypothetical protein
MMRLFCATLVLLCGCVTAPAVRDDADSAPPSKVKTVAAGLEQTVKTLSDRFATLQLKTVSRAEQPGGVLLVLRGPEERRAAVSSGGTGFTTTSFVFHRRYTLRFVTVDEGHTRIEASTTAEFEDQEVCNPVLDRRDQLGLAPHWGPGCAQGAAFARPNVDVVDSNEERWVAAQDDGENPLVDLLAD